MKTLTQITTLLIVFVAGGLAGAHLQCRHERQQEQIEQQAFEQKATRLREEACADLAAQKEAVDAQMRDRAACLFRHEQLQQLPETIEL